MGRNAKAEGGATLCAQQSCRIHAHAQQYQNGINDATNIGVTSTLVDSAGNVGSNKQDQHSSMQPCRNTRHSTNSPLLETSGYEGSILDNDDQQRSQAVQKGQNKQIQILILAEGRTVALNINGNRVSNKEKQEQG